MDISKFNEKFNKVEGNTYVVEEKIDIYDRIYESELAHDNANIKSLNVYTGSKLTGDKVETYSISTPSLTPWKTIIKIFSKVTPLYISYETIGDQVEADDINNLQEALVYTQENLNIEIDRATKFDKVLTENLDKEINRATGSEKSIYKDLNTEVVRAKNLEKVLMDNLDAESNRAKSSEEALTNNLNNEISRAIQVENTISSNFSEEIIRAKNEEKKLSNSIDTTNTNLNNEVTRSKDTETNLSNEVTRATNAEKNLSDNLETEVNRATAGENTLNTNLTAEINRSKALEKSLTDNIDSTNNNLNSEISRSKSVESDIAGKLNEEIGRSKTKENSIEVNINSCKTYNDAEIQGLKEKDIDLQNKKSDKVYVDAELNKRYTKDQTFTKEEVLQKIKDVIGTAPEALDTLQEIAKALNNDSDFAGTMTKQLAIKVNKVQGKQLTDENYTLVDKNKLSKIENEANKYIHPANHSSDMIIDNANKRFTNDTEKANNLVAYNKIHEHTNKSIIDKITQALLDNWDAAYTHINDVLKHVTCTERNNWNEAYNNISDNTRHITSDERSIWNTVSKKADNAHVHSYKDLNNKPSIPSKTSELNNDVGFITQKNIDTSQDHTHSNKYLLDKINQSLIDSWNTISNKADKVHKHLISEIDNMPSSLPANGGTASRIYGNMASNDFIRIEGQGNNDNGSLEIATADNGNEPIYVRQYTGDFTNVSRTLTLLDGNGNTVCPGILNANDLQVKGANVYTTIRKPTPVEIGAMKKGPVNWNDLKGV